MMLDDAVFNEFMLAFKLKMKHSELMTMQNREYLGWHAFFKRCAVEKIPL